ncbi:uncharacterized protein LOC133778235 [Humulus lupulus]|uniref:uncharacterized protein LOC133778235 n=1 Tax=Humulus lupulus TaxID=3486 RepID=UPI002B40D1BE|nr:uncharacterized protein LOC133778235 [Humulus lupulus]XP_062074090.1 uncharacterized protein LOC133778235 [Humulus lupulus]
MGEFSIQISRNLVNSLAGNDEDKSKKKTKRTRAKSPRVPQQQPQTKANQKQVSDNFETHKGSTSTGWPLQPPMFLPVPPTAYSSSAELDAIRSVLQESERVVERLQKQEDNMVQEVTQRAKDLRDKEFKLPYQKPLPCVAENEACLSCYKEHLKDPLKCAHLVRNFADCARKVRQQVSSAQ